MKAEENEASSRADLKMRPSPPCLSIQEVLCLGGGQVRTSLRPIPASIFQSWVLVLQRDEPAVTGAGSGVEEEH